MALRVAASGAVQCFFNGTSRRTVHLAACPRMCRRVLPTKTICRSIYASPTRGEDTSAIDIWRRAQAVCFDVDSTVSEDEAIDVLAKHLGVEDAVKELTARAMGGSMTFQEALSLRLGLMRPSLKAIEECLHEQPTTLSPGVSEVISILQKRGTAVYLVSGGFHLTVRPVARQLHIPDQNIFANTLLFDDNGDYKGFDPEEPTSRSGGKAEVISMLKQRHGYDPIVVVGDGVTDMEARPPADLFIGYGGVQAREAVVKGADWFVTDFAELARALKS